MLFCLMLAMLFCLLLALLFSILFILSPLLDDERSSASASSLRCSSRCPRSRVALLRSSRDRLFGCGSVSDSHHWPFGYFCLGSSSETVCGGLQFPRCLACTSNTTTQHCALRARWLAVGARAPRSCSLQQRVLLTVRTGLRGSLPLRSVGGFQFHSDTTVWFSALCPPSQRRLTSRPLATAWSVGSFGTAGVSSILVSHSLVWFLSRPLSHAHFPSRVPFSLALHAGATHAFELC